MPFFVWAVLRLVCASLVVLGSCERPRFAAATAAAGDIFAPTEAVCVGGGHWKALGGQSRVSGGPWEARGPLVAVFELPNVRWRSGAHECARERARARPARASAPIPTAAGRNVAAALSCAAAACRRRFRPALVVLPWCARRDSTTRAGCARKCEEARAFHDAAPRPSFR